MRENYNVTIKSVEFLDGHDITGRERILLKDTSNAEDLINHIGERIAPSAFVTLDVHNEYVKDGGNTDYRVYMILAQDGTKYKTSSESFADSLADIWADIIPELDISAGEVFEIEIIGIPSKNYKGNNILSCSLV